MLPSLSGLSLFSTVMLTGFVASARATQQSTEQDLFQQIRRDLYEFRKGITYDMVEQTYCSNTDQGEPSGCLCHRRDSAPHPTKVEV